MYRYTYITPYTQIRAVLVDMIKESYTFAEGTEVSLCFMYHLFCHKYIQAPQWLNHLFKI
jgi:hypothetical protein